MKKKQENNKSIKMDDKTVTALEGSIGKWEAICDGTGRDLGATNCPLCRMFLKCEMFRSPHCTGCPVATQSEEFLCKNTPYIAWSDHPSHPGKLCGICKKLAENELRFLKSLLPQNKKKIK